MTIEDLRLNAKGELLSNNLATYKIPDIYFMPDQIDIKFLTEENPMTPYDSKVLGEPPLMYGIGVFFAIRQAMRAFNSQDGFGFVSPLTPERVLCELYRNELQEIAKNNVTSLSLQPSQ